MVKSELKWVIEALLMSANEPLSLDNLRDAFDDWNKPSHEQLREALDSLEEDYISRSIELRCLAGRYCLQTKIYYSPWIMRLSAEKPVKYSRALLETLAIIAYRQPVTRGDIEEIRGVAVSSTILKTLIEREWIRIAGHRDVPGKPAIYTTTRIFLDYFNLTNLEEMPPLPVLEKSFEDQSI